MGPRPEDAAEVAVKPEPDNADFYRPPVRLERHLAVTGFLSDDSRAVAHRVATLLGLPYTDIDRLVEHQAGRSLVDVVRETGIHRYRELENRCLRQALGDSPPAVISLGDGTVIDRRNLEAVLKAATLVVLDLDLPNLYWRLQSRGAQSGPCVWQHPLNSGPIETLDQLRPFYVERRAGFDAAHHRVALRGRRLEAVAHELLELLTSPGRGGASSAEA